ncbi:alanyl-tRNA editing protein [Arhodomonas sp. AD133]|uniref:alanyl-tRNA editing protein n=1 Tax=Arhodomonas sp. AD133 TaxID=3415009 RepID=UPI003EB985AD
MTQASPVTPTERLFEEDAYATEGRATVVEVHPQGIILDRTLFYAESGGQPGDTGTLHLPDGRELAVRDTRYLPGKLRVVHVLDDPQAVSLGTELAFTVDWDRRYRHMRMHTCLHVLCGLVDAPVTGCSVNAARSRLDFDLPESVFTRETLDERLQAEIAADRPVRHSWHTGAEVAAALADARTVKAPAVSDDTAVRMIEIGGLDLQPCGGTHVRSTGELAGLRIGKIQKKSKHNRRISVVEDES